MQNNRNTHTSCVLIYTFLRLGDLVTTTSYDASCKVIFYSQHNGYDLRVRGRYTHGRVVVSPSRAFSKQNTFFFFSSMGAICSTDDAR